MRKEIIALGIVFISWSSLFAAGDKGDMGIGFRGGLNRLQGDLKNPAFSPFLYGNLNYNVNDFFTLGAEGGYSIIEDKDSPDFRTILNPYEVHATLNFLPLSRVNPYAIIGGGGVYWNATFKGETIRFPLNTGKLQKGFDSFLKAGAGLEFSINKSRSVSLSLGATYRYSLTDMLDQNYEGDLNDGVIDIYAGLSYFFRIRSRGDKDGDGVPDELDLAPEQVEDADGYFDHDGKPEGVPHLAGVQSNFEVEESSNDEMPPVVIHNPLKKAEAGKDIKLSAEIYENFKLNVAAVLYRSQNASQWNVIKLESTSGLLYQGVIPGDSVTKDGLEYCVIAVDEAISGIGYCGLPRRPVITRIIANPTAWRLFNGTVALIGWGAAGYLISKDQK